MEYAKDEIFIVKYNTSLNKLGAEDEKWTSRIIRKIQYHKLFTTVIIALFLFSFLNMVLIYSFMKILQNIWI